MLPLILPFMIVLLPHSGRNSNPEFMEVVPENGPLGECTMCGAGHSPSLVLPATVRGDCEFDSHSMLFTIELKL